MWRTANNVPIEKLTIGTVVKLNAIFSEPTDVGHIVRFSRNDTYDELVLVVQWSRREQPEKIHPSNVQMWVIN